MSPPFDACIIVCAFDGSSITTIQVAAIMRPNHSATLSTPPPHLPRGYLLTQVAGGIWADKFGGKMVLGWGVAWWSVATALTPIAASMGLPALLAARALMGIGEGVAMPAMNNMLSR